MISAHLRRSLWVAIFASAALLLAVAQLDRSGPTTSGERIQSLAESYACPECTGQSVAESNAAVAVTIRDFIRNEVNAGATDLEIRDALILAYGGDVLLTPPSDGIGSVIWILPVLVIVASCTGLGVVLTRQRGASRALTDDDQNLVAKARADLGS